MLGNLKAGDTIDEDGTIEELKNSCESALPKIKNMLKEEEDEEKIEELKEVRSIIKGVVLKYQDIKHGHYDTKYDISGKFKSESDADKNMPPPAISLIDLDDINESSSSSSPAFSNTTLQKSALDEMSDIFGEKTDISSPSSSADPFDLLSRSIKANTLPPSSPNLPHAQPNTSSSSPAAHNEDIQKSSKYIKHSFYL
jgi:hypothetical protein